jgi:hypothetical protein
MLGLFQADPSVVTVDGAKDFADLQLPTRQLQIDVKGQIAVIGSKATVQVGEIKRNNNQYAKAKAQLVIRAKFLQWAVAAALRKTDQFVLMGHVFVPKGSDTPNSEMQDEVSIFLHTV